MKVTLQVERAVARWVDARTRARLVEVAARAGRRLGLSGEALRGLGLRIVGDRTMIALHRQHLGTAVPTDVLSFPADADAPWAGPGDIAIDWDQVRRQAARADAHAWCDEAAQLLVHGLAHLVGHDHGRRGEARRMLRAEHRAARSAAIATPVRPYGPPLGGR